MLEQYQAQIGSALTPAFAADSSPELAAEAINVCATFIATGIVTDVDRMGRILKLLIAALENFSSELDNDTVVDMNLTECRRNRDCGHWRSERAKLKRSGHGKNVRVLCMGRTSNCER